MTRHADRAAAMIKGFISDTCPADADGQLTRVAARFALVAAVGEIATEFGVLPWAEGDATDGATSCFRPWLASRGGSGATEDRDALATVRRFIEAHGSSRFEAKGVLAPTDSNGHTLDQRIINRVGFKRVAEDGDGTDHLFLPEVWKAEVCAGLDASRVAKMLADRGHLIRDRVNMAIKPRLPGLGPKRVYAVRSSVLADAD